MSAGSQRAWPSAVLTGVAVLGVWVAVRQPVPGQPAWGEAMLLLSALVLVPLALSLLAPMNRVRLLGVTHEVPHITELGFVAGTSLAGAYLMPQGLAATALALPWFGFTGAMALWGAARMRGRLKNTARRGQGGLSVEEAPSEPPGESKAGEGSSASLIAGVTVDSALVFLLVGGLWALTERLGQQPLGFSHDIVLLTAVHFHHAGFTLPLLAGLIARLRPTAANRLGAGLSLVGVPLVAAGIVATQVGPGPAIELVAVAVVVIGALLVALAYLREGLAQTGWTSGLWLGAALALAVGMALAGGYGARFLTPRLAQVLDFPTMRVWHGTLNAVGFGLAGLLGWRLSGLIGGPEVGPTRDSDTSA